MEVWHTGGRGGGGYYLINKPDKTGPCPHNTQRRKHSAAAHWMCIARHPGHAAPESADCAQSIFSTTLRRPCSTLSARHFALQKPACITFFSQAMLCKWRLIPAQIFR